MPSGFKLRRIHRLTSGEDYSRVFNAPRRLQDKLITILYRPNDYGRPRIGFAIAKKKVPKSFFRNRIRRICKETFRYRRQHFPALDIIILARQAAARASKEDLFISFMAHWKKIEEK